MRRTSSLKSIDPLVERNIGTDKYQDVVTVADHITAVQTVANNIPAINTTNLNAGAITTVAGSIEDVKLTALNMPDINSVVDNLSGLSIIAGDLMNSCIPAILDNGLITDTNLDANCTSTSTLQALAQDITAVIAVGNNLPNINIVAADLAEPTSEIDTVATSIVNVNAVGDNIIPVTTVATNIAGIVAVSTNMAEVLMADDNAATATAMASTATTKAGEASASAAAALASEQNVVSLLDQFDDRYLGSKASDPLVDNDGAALLDGALYWNTTTNQMMVYDLGNLVWLLALTLSAGGAATLTNKTMDSITNTIGANHLHYPVRNITGSIIPAGTVVHAHATQPGTDYITVEPMTNPGAEVALGIVHSALAVNGSGLCMNTGLSTDVVNTSGWAVGTILYPAAGGGLTPTRPATGWYQACAVVLRSHATQGTLLIEFTEPTVRASDVLNAEIDFTIDLGGLV